MAVADFTALALAAAVCRRAPPRWLVLLASVIALGTIWSEAPMETVRAAARILALGWVLASIEGGRREFLAGAVIAGLPQLAAMALDLPGRASGLSANASQAGLLGMALVTFPMPASLLGAGMIWTSFSRTALVASMLWLADSRRRIVALAAVAATGVLFAWGFDHLGRLAAPGEDLALRLALIRDLPPWEVRGFGVDAFYEATGKQRPHVHVLVLAYEMGALAIVPVGIFIWAVASRRLPARLGLLIFLTGFLVDEYVGRPEGVYLVGLMCWWHAGRRRGPALSPQQTSGAEDEPHGAADHAGSPGQRTGPGARRDRAPAPCPPPP